MRKRSTNSITSVDSGRKTGGGRKILKPMVSNVKHGVLTPVILIEVIFQIVLVDLIKLTGIFARWNFIAASQLLNSKQVVSFWEFHRRMRSSKDPSNQMSDGIIHWLLGIGIWFGA